MLRQEEYDKIKNAIIKVEGEDYVPTTKTRLKNLGYRYSFFKRTWTKNNIRGMLTSITITKVKKWNNNYLAKIDLDAMMENSLVGYLMLPHIVEIIVK